MNNLYQDQNNELINLINILSFMVGLENMQENRQQSQYNDVHRANDEQAELILEKINKRFAEQNENIAKILAIQQNHTDMLREIYRLLRNKKGKGFYGS